MTKFKLLNNAYSFTDNNGIIEIISPPKTDFFNDIGTDNKTANAPFYYTVVENDFILRCLIKPELKNVYDAGGVFVFESEDKWIKFSLEKTDLGYNSLVSVITNKTSDDCNGERIHKEAMWMQVVRKNHNWCLHYSENKTNWKMVRYFRLKMKRKVRVGLISQSPLGEGCKAEFYDFELLNYSFDDIRKAT